MATDWYQKKIRAQTHWAPDPTQLLHIMPKQQSRHRRKRKKKVRPHRKEPVSSFDRKIWKAKNKRRNRYKCHYRRCLLSCSTREQLLEHTLIVHKNVPKKVCPCGALLSRKRDFDAAWHVKSKRHFLYLLRTQEEEAGGF